MKKRCVIGILTNMQNIFCFEQFFDRPPQSFSFIDKGFEKVANKF